MPPNQKFTRNDGIFEAYLWVAAEASVALSKTRRGGRMASLFSSFRSARSPQASMRNRNVRGGGGNESFSNVQQNEAGLQDACEAGNNFSRRFSYYYHVLGVQKFF